MICDTCKQRTFSGAPSRCKGCQTWVPSWGQKLCENCSDELKVCQHCEIPMGTSHGPSLKTLISKGQLFLRLNEQEKGSSKTIKVGTPIVIELPPLGYYSEWQFEGLDTSIVKLERLVEQRPKLSEEDSRYRWWGWEPQPTKIFVIMRAIAPGGPIKVQLVEAQKRSWWGGYSGKVPNGKTFGFTLTVKP